MISSPSQLIPAEIKRELDKDVIGQEQAKKILSVALHSHMIRIQKADQAAAERNKRMPNLSPFCYPFYHEPFPCCS